MGFICLFDEIHFMLITRPRPKARGRVLNLARFVCLFVCLFFPSVSQIGTLETLICARAVFRLRALASTLFSVGINEKHEIMVLACQVGPLHLKLTQINSEMKCIAKNKCP